MFTLFHFVFELVKIALQAAVYSLVVKLIIFLYTKITGSNQRTVFESQNIYLAIAGSLFIFSFTYYGNHGLGDDANIPLGYGITMNGSDGYSYLNLKNNSQININSFLVRNDHLCFASNNNYYDYQLASGKLAKYLKRQDYEAYAFVNKLPRVNEFTSFYTQYDAYWNGWRFWFLP